MCGVILEYILKANERALKLSLCQLISGYGNFATKTFGGRLFCLLFGIIGIPFMLSGEETM